MEPYRRKRDFWICGAVGVCATTRDELVQAILHLPVSPISATVNLIGVPAVIASKENFKIADMYSKASIAAIDGMPIVKIGRKKGYQCERCAAPDIMGLIFSKSIEEGKTHYFYGGKDNKILEKLRVNLEQNYPNIKIAGMYSPPFRPLTDAENLQIVNTINDVQPDFLWVGIGAPKQELWMLEHQEPIHDCVMLGVGAGFDFLAGTLDKAPVFFENHSLEWLYRLYKEPRRLWKRYMIGGIKYIYYSAIQALKR